MNAKRQTTVSHAMTSRERMLAAIRHELVDRVPVSPWGTGRIALDSPLGARLLAETDPWIEAFLTVSPLLGEGILVEHCHRGEETEMIIHLPDRDLRQVQRTTDQTTATVRFACQTVEDLDALLDAPYVPPRYDHTPFCRLAEKVGDDGLVTLGVADGLCYPNDWLGTELCSLLWASEPELIQRFVQIAHRRTMALLEQALEAGVDCVRIVGGEYATQLMGQKAWDELIVPYDGELVKLIHAYGAIAHYHNHGYMDRFIEKIADLGIDSLDPIEQPPYGDLEMVEAQRRIGDRVCLLGGLDDMEILETHELDDVLARGRRLLLEMAPIGFMLGGTSSGIYGERALDSFCALARLSAEFASASG